MAKNIHIGKRSNCSLGVAVFANGDTLYQIYDNVYQVALRELFKSSENAFDWLDSIDPAIVEDSIESDADCNASDSEEVTIIMDLNNWTDSLFKFQSRASRSKNKITGPTFEE